ncbi:hypothetical protein J31TS6_57220 [Brevibacillus reuszeri]|uniref:hypothetical protein n=1 Tax=Brevibacillus reuszeri TaxID=54915 RepID=UPI001B07BC55|nr:hypothetical protein [Brevibacillus reuszeri]GIO09694.1 hypothetical protein J31TS6_57220 [Brevibacillus reuszeri]
MATERKPVCFNLNDSLEREMWELAKSRNFSGWVKAQMKPLALARIAERQAASEPRRMGVPVPVRKVVPANAPEA